MTNSISLDEQTITLIGLKRSDKSWSAWTGPSTRVYEYPGLEGVYVMDSDLYGNPMPKESCFLAFVSEHGVIGEHLTISKLISSTPQEIQGIVNKDQHG